MSMSAADQYLLEMMNRARLDPVAEAARYGIDLNEGLAPGSISASSKQVLAPNEALDTAASAHTKWMLDTDTFSHTGAGGSQPWDRAGDAGYDWNAIGENIAWVGSTGAIDIEASVEAIQRNLFLSPGHRENLMNASYREIGVSVETGAFTSGSNYNALMATELFGLSGSAVFVTGVAYTDTDADLFYTMGEGRGGVTFTAQGTSDVTEAAGGYAVGVAANAAVAVTGMAGGTAFSCTLDMSAGNVKLDLVSGTTFFTSGSIVLGTGVQNVMLLGLNGLNATGNDSANLVTGSAGNNVLDGRGGNDKIAGGGGNDRLIGGSGQDSLTGLSGADQLSGGSENDMLNGGGGNDILNGGAGKDRMTGGGGADVFVFARADGLDTVKDFSVSSKDILQLDDAIWAGSVLSKAQVIAEFASVTADGVLLDFGGVQSILLAGLTSTTGLSSQIEII